MKTEKKSHDYSDLLQNILKVLRCCNVSLSICKNLCKNIAVLSHNHEHVRGRVNEAFLICLLFYGIQSIEYTLLFKRLWSDFVIIFRCGWGYYMM